MSEKVLVVTGGFVTANDNSALRSIKKQILQWKTSQSAWLELKVKALIAEPLLYGALEKKKWLSRYQGSNKKNLEDFFKSTVNSDPPSLTEVVLTSLLHSHGIDYEVTTYDFLFRDDKTLNEVLDRTTCVFASSTFLRDLSELEPLMRKLKRPHNKIVVGGALAGSLCHTWEGMPEVDILAVGYGELLAPTLAHWIKSGYKEIQSPKTGKVYSKKHSVFVHSGVPETLSLDFLPTPGWKLTEDFYGKKFSMIYYESVRGCPYRCAFCNYPYLFDDQKFRVKSAKKMAEDWEYYVKELGVEYITCLDSLFTMPKPRLVEFCKLLIEKNIKVKWICYARADDLCDLEVVELMKRAGCLQVQIGIESGDQGQLTNMNKRILVEKNKLAILNCKKGSLTSVISLIVGFPGETVESLENTYQFLKETKPDFYFLAVFSTRVPGVPILQPESMQKFGLKVLDNPYSVAPYWKHDTMSCADVGNHVRQLNYKIMSERISLDSTLFYKNLLDYTPAIREDLLDYQQSAILKRSVTRKMFNVFNAWVDKKLRKDVELSL